MSGLPQSTPTPTPGRLVWRPGSVVAPLLGGYLMGNVGMASVFYVGGGAAIFAAALFLAALITGHGRNALTDW